MTGFRGYFSPVRSVGGKGRDSVACVAVGLLFIGGFVLVS